MLAACGSAPESPEENPATVPAAPAAPAPAPALETTPLAERGEAVSPAPEAAKRTQQVVTKPAKSKDSAKGEVVDTAPVEEPIPPAAAQQFDSAVAMMNSNNAAGAEQAFRALGTAYPAYSGALLNLGILQVKAGRLDEAEKTLRGAIERNPSAAAYNQLGIVYRRLGRFKEADEAYQQALQIDPAYANALLNLGVLCDLYLRQPQRALESYERYLQVATSPDAKVSGWVTELKARLGAQPRTARSEP